MHVNRWVLMSLAPVLVGCVSGVISNQLTPDSPPNTPGESAIATTNLAQARVVKFGRFTSGEHPTQGQARIVAQGSQLFLDLDPGFKTSNLGPDLVVALHRSSRVLDSTKPPAYPLTAGSYVVLAPLQKFSGAQRYAIPASLNVANFESAVIWCRQFNATFGAASLVNQ